MLIITRKTNQKIHIGSDITIEVVDIRGSQVRIGISAPKDVLVLREELVPGGPAGTGTVSKH